MCSHRILVPKRFIASHFWTDISDSDRNLENIESKCENLNHIHKNRWLWKEKIPIGIESFQFIVFNRKISCLYILTFAYYLKNSSSAPNISKNCWFLGSYVNQTSSRKSWAIFLVCVHNNHGHNWVSLLSDKCLIFALFETRRLWVKLFLCKTLRV